VQPERQTTREPPVIEPYAPSDLLSMTPSQPSQTGGAAAQAVYFTFSGFTFEGATLLSEEELLPLYVDAIGKEINLAQLYALADQIENAYTNQGYILTRTVIPAQEIGHGDKIKLIIIEGYIDKVEIETDDPGIEDFLQEMAEPILESRPLKLSTLEKVLLLMDDLPGLSVQSVLSPSPTTQGASRLTIKVSEKKYALEAHVDNRGTAYTGPVEYLADITLNNPGGYISQTQLEGTVSDPTHEMSAVSLTHVKPFGQYGTYAEAMLNYSQVNPGYTLSELDVNGYSSLFELSANQPLIRQRQYNLSAWMRYDILGSKTNTLGQLLYFDQIESIRAGLMFDIVDSWFGNNLVTTEVSQGVNLFTGDNKPPLERSRVFGTKDYTKVTASATRLQSLPWNFDLFISGQGQYAANPLLAAEEFGVGGEDYGLAYDYFEIAGDTGYAGRIELRRSFFPNKWLVDFVQPYISFDGGQVFQKKTNIQQSLTSLGGGLRFDFTQFLIGQLEIAKPLTKEVAATDSKDPRGFFYFTALF
jgi:hemolysin activation/secretion protein